MKSIPNSLRPFLAVLFLLVGQLATAQNLHLFGVPNKNDACFKTIKTADGSHLVAGVVDNDAAIYKFNCQGQLVDSVRGDLSLASSFEGFYDLLELPGGDILAVGYAKVVSPAVNHSVVVRFNPGLDFIAFDTLKINGKTGEARAVVRSDLTGEVFIAGMIAGPGLDFADAYWQKIDPTTLSPIGPATTFSYGIDEIHRVNQTADGQFLIAGNAVLGNIFSGEADLINRSFCRKIKADGSLVWDFQVEQVLKNKFGRTGFVDAIENPLSGNIFIAGQSTTGDTTNNTLDATYWLLSPVGLELASTTFEKIGAQHIYQTRAAADAPGLFISLGDSTDLTGGGQAVFFSTAVFEFGDQLIPGDANTNYDLAGLSPRSFWYESGGRFQIAGIYQNPNGGASNHDVFFATNEAFSVQIEQNGPQLEAQPSQGIGLAYQWLFQNQPVGGATDTIFTPTQNGQYQVIATNLSGCTASATFNFNGTPNGTAPLFWAVDTLCQPDFLFRNGIVNDAASYAWNFGDGATSTDKQAFHMYSMPGIFDATLCIQTKPGQMISTGLKVISCGANNPLEFLVDGKSDPYFDLLNSTGAVVFTSHGLQDIDPPFVIPGAFLLTPGETYKIELYDYDFVGFDDFLGDIFLPNAAAGGTFTFGNVTIEFQTTLAEASYCWTETVVVVPKPNPTIVWNAALNRLECTPIEPGVFYTWFVNNTTVPNSNSPFLVNPTTGVYSVHVLKRSCSEVNSPDFQFTVSASEPAWLAEMQLSPNPTDGLIFLGFPTAGEPIGESRVRVFSTEGRLVKMVDFNFQNPTQRLLIDFEEAAPGVYFVRLECSKGSGVRKVVVR